MTVHHQASAAQAAVAPPTLRNRLAIKEELMYFNVHDKVQSSLIPKQAVLKIERAYQNYSYHSRLQATLLLRNLLKAHGLQIEDLDELDEDNVFVVHRQKLGGPLQHGFIGEMFERMGDSHILIKITEVTNAPRVDYAVLKRIKFKCNFFPDKGLYTLPFMAKSAQLEYLVNEGSVFKMPMSHDQLENAINLVCDQIKRRDGTGYYGNNFDCNIFIYDVLRKVFK